jgi:hypothetical protein
MAKRMDVVAPKKVTDKSGNEKTYWNKIGSCWIDGDKMRLNLESIPVNWDGFALISEPKEQTGGAAGKPQNTPSGRSNPQDRFGDFDDGPSF